MKITTPDNNCFMTDSIFSRYSQGENHVTSTFLAVLKQLSLHNMDYLISAILGDEIELVEFNNQPSSGNVGVPDAEITANIRILIETKVERNSVDRAQLDRHLLSLKDSSNEYLFILTPDKDQPEKVNELINDLHSKGENKQVAWASFAQLSAYIDSLITESINTVSEHECFILKQFDLLLDNKGLLAPEEDTVIVAARSAWSIYLDTGVYACQVNRSFRAVDYMGFYNQGNIQPKIAKIIDSVDDVELLPNLHQNELGIAVDRLLAERPEMKGHRQKVFLLSPQESADTRTLENAIKNVSKSKSDKTTAFTMSQRYVVLSNLVGAKNTDDIWRNQSK